MGQEKLKRIAESFGLEFAHLVRKYLPHFPSNIEESALLDALRLQSNVYSRNIWGSLALQQPHPTRKKPIPKRRRRKPR